MFRINLILLHAEIQASVKIMILQTNFYDPKLYFALVHGKEFLEILEPMKWDKITNHIPRDEKMFGFTSDFIEDKYGLLFTMIRDEVSGLTGGGQFLESVYNTIGEGPDAEVFFEVGEKRSNTYLPIKKWRIYLVDYNTDYGGVSTTIEKMPFQAKYRARATAPCTINEYQNMDGEELTRIPSYTLRLHSKKLLQSTQAISASPQVGNQKVSDLQLYYVVQPDLSNQSITELNEVFNQTFALVDTETGTDPSTAGTPAAANIAALNFKPFTIGLSQYIATTNGSLDVKWSGTSNFYYYKNAGDSMWWQITPRVVVQRNDVIVGVYVGTTYNLSTNAGGAVPHPSAPMVCTYPYNIATAGEAYILPGVTGSVPRHNVVRITDYTWDELFQNIPISQGDNVYVQHVMCPPFASGTTGFDCYIMFDKFLNDIKFTQLTSTKGSKCEAFRIGDVLNQMLENVTGQKNAMVSSFFGAGGFGYKYMLANGYSIRNFGGIAYRFKKDIASLLTDLQAIFFTGVGFKEDNFVDKMVVEYAPDFMRNRVIGTYKQTFDWKFTHGAKYCFNKAKLGYNKYEGLNLIQNDEFCTEGDYLLQWLKIQDNILDKKSSLIASGYLLENQRRNQYSANPGQSLTFDEDIFIVATSEPMVFHDFVISCAEAANSPKIDFFTQMNLEKGDIVSFELAPYGVINIRIKEQDPGFPYISVQDRYTMDGGANWVSMTPYILGDIVWNVADLTMYFCFSPVISATDPSLDPAHWRTWFSIGGTYDVTIYPASPDEVFAERNNCFEICQNVLSPETIYNGRLSLKHILANWRPLLGVGLHFVDVDSPDYSVSKMIPTLVRMNSLFTHKFLSTEEFKGNVGNQTLTEITRDPIKQYLANGENIFSPMGATCRIKIGWNEMEVIRKALCGELNDDTKDFGGLILGDYNGNLWFCHVMDLNYNPVSQMCDLMVQTVRRVWL